MDMLQNQTVEINQPKDLLTELPLAAFIRYRKLLVPKMGRIDIHEKYGISMKSKPIDSSLYCTPMRSLSENSISELENEETLSTSSQSVSFSLDAKSPSLDDPIDIGMPKDTPTNFRKVLFVYKL